MNDLNSIEINLSVKKPVTESKSSQPEKNTAIQNRGESNKIKNHKIDHELFESAKNQDNKIVAPGIDELMEKIQQYVNTFNTKLSFSYDEEQNRPIIYVIDKENNEVIRQIPPKKMFKLIRNLEEIRGIIFQGQA
ncbi:MAG: flagellar protein FlaG [Candidatus Marinimicrobia bacterium]|nr:flagellar protein FlaG [Candidatus Neomarinimicrobiota bacterium]